MGQRRILVIGSQCEALGHLDFLPQVAQDFYAVMTDPERGGCEDAVSGKGILLDPTVAEAREAIELAFDKASEDERTLFLAFVGHGEFAGDDHYLLPKDAKLPPRSHTAIHIGQLVKELQATGGKPDGFAVLLDTCYSGVAVKGAARKWIGELSDPSRFELMSASGDRPAYAGCFTRTLTAQLRDGMADVPSEHLLCMNVRAPIEARCASQVPEHIALNPDPTLWLARNVAKAPEPWAQTSVASEIERLTLAYQRTPALEEIVALTKVHRCVAVVGAAGSGKSALAAALAWPKVTGGSVPASFVHAIALITEATTPLEFARQLGEQLDKATSRAFLKAQTAFARSIPLGDQQKLDTLEKQLIGPLKRLPPDTQIRIVVDALDRLATGARLSVMKALETLSSNAELAFVRLVVTARPDTELPAGSQTFELGPAADESIEAYLARRGIPDDRQTEVLRAARGSWLVARLLADQFVDDPSAASAASLSDVYDDLLQRCGATSNDDTLRTLVLLAAAGAGPVLPLALLCAASEALGGPSSPARVRDHLVRMRGLVVRTAAGTDQEVVGLFHQTLADHVAAWLSVASSIHVADAHRALAQAIGALAPAASTQHALEEPIARYAFEREAEHWWALGETDKALASLVARTSPIPRENLRRWKGWEQRLSDTFGPGHPTTLTTRNNIALFTGQAGDAATALRLSTDLLSDQERVLGPNHPDTLTTRNNIALFTGQAGDAATALRLSTDLLSDQERVLGPNHPDTLRTRLNIAGWIGQSGDAATALQLFTDLLPDYQRVLGPDHPDTLTTRNNIALFTGQSGDAATALQLFTDLLPDYQRVLGPDHPDTLTTRNNIALFTGQSGDAATALQLFSDLLLDQERVLGPNHPDTLRTRLNIALFTGQSGDAATALQLFTDLLPDQLRALGADHPDTLTIRNNIAAFTGQSGDAATALQLFTGLLPDYQRVLGPNHPDTLRTRNNIALFTGQSGDAATALQLFTGLLPDYQRVLGPNHPDTLRTRNNIALFTGQSGDAATALQLFTDLLPDQLRVLGPNHPDTLRTRNNIALFTGQSGDAATALQLFTGLLPDYQRVLGPNHPDTLRTRNNIALFTGQSGDAATALRLSTDLLPDYQRVLGPNHPDTLRTRNNIALFTGQSGDAATALRLSTDLLPDYQRVLGPNHPDTLTTRLNIALFTGQSGDAATALRLSTDLLPDYQRVLGPNHPDTLRTRLNIALFTGQSGDAATALQLFSDLLPDYQRVLGTQHPGTRVILEIIAPLGDEASDQGRA